MSRLLIVAGLTALIHAVNTLIYGVRLSGVRTERLATAISLFNVVFLVASTANMVQAPLLASIVDRAINAGLSAGGVGSPVYQQHLAVLEEDMRVVILAATAGTLLGALAIPPFVQLFSRIILLFDEVGSVPRLAGMVLFSPRRVYRFFAQARIPRATALRAAVQTRGLPKTFLIMNVLVIGIYTIGVLSALYAGALFPEFRSTATLLSGIVNGIATVLVATIVDPTAARITDQALRGVRPESDVKSMVACLAGTRLLGTLLAQILLLPAAEWIRFVAQLIA
ncbi:MAG: lipid II flippase Amj family protein [Thermoanaerobacterales bacterium]|nr:lipid II flippase Amj family protein [Bacillota bacterium]MDI6906063.1 lipid II flippase Amj family protein [Thermoanaerobacterales bacterium]